MNKRMLKNLAEETKVLANLNSTHVIKTYTQIKTERHYYLIVEYCNGGDLDSLIAAGLILKEKHVQHIFRGILKALRDLQDQGIMHRDIKNANILLKIPQEVLEARI
jgi:serine/threonine protein kinase